MLVNCRLFVKHFICSLLRISSASILYFKCKKCKFLKVFALECINFIFL